MNGLTTALASLVLAATAVAASAAAPSATDKIAACQANCDAIEEETDRVTCRLNCREANDEENGPSVTRWKEERSVGGPAPGQDKAPPPVRTVTTTTPSGTTTTTNAPPQPSRGARTPTATKVPARSPRAAYYFGLVDCQDRCNGRAEPIARAQCKMVCLRRSPGPPPPPSAAPAPVRTPAATAPTTAKTKTTATTTPAAPPRTHQPAPIQPAVDCTARCAGEATEDDRQTCKARCDYAQRRKAQPSTQTTTTSVEVRPDECRRLCTARESSCTSGCSGSGSDASTCRLQCEQSARRCADRCSGQ